MDIILSKDKDICYLLSKKNSQEQLFHLVVRFCLGVQWSESEFFLSSSVFLLHWDCHSQLGLGLGLASATNM
jgi:hypothetical protein